ncbi:RNA-guided endonuclease InsQ/TnpB family protein [Bacillus taeanensis]|uniref:Transposase n=1 Tax=Bacillus taeanensis TaxID=273032 RepID=A0A366XXN8_9BACI|nr:RNA-guided endonuclease TnpB family protein [Bacillus taeanensis]RBW68904.1 transposase [Bacillus taeanensis]
MKKAYKVEINPTEQQEQKIKQTIGVCRYVYNLYLSKNKETHEKEKKFMSGYDFSKWLNNVHTKQADQWIKDVSSKAVKQSAMNAERAFKNFFKGLTKFPRFKKKKNQDVKAYFPKNNKTDWTVERHRVKIPTIGWMKVKEYGYIPTNAIVKSGTVSHKAGRYYVSVLCEVDAKNNQMNTNDGIGVDLGIKDFSVCSHHENFGNINKTLHVKKIEKKLKREQRSLSRKYENLKKKGGETAAKKRANIDKNLLRLQKIHARLTNIREEYVRTVVNSLVKAKPKYITIEDLNVKGMMKNRHLSDSIRKQKFYRFKQWLTSKCREHEIELRMVDRFYPSSKTCSCCGFKKVELSLSERVFKCDNCDMELDRDFNASLNLKYAAEYTIVTTR